MLIQCCVCKRIESGTEWIPVDEIVYDASHTYCPECAKVARAEIRAFNHARQALSPRRSGQSAPHDLFNPLFFTKATADESF